MFLAETYSSMDKMSNDAAMTVVCLLMTMPYMLSARFLHEDQEGLLEVQHLQM